MRPVDHLRAGREQHIAPLCSLCHWGTFLDTERDRGQHPEKDGFQYPLWDPLPSLPSFARWRVQLKQFFCLLEEVQPSHLQAKVAPKPTSQPR